MFGNCYSITGAILVDVMLKVPIILSNLLFRFVDPVIPKRNHRHRPLQLLSRKFASMHTAAPNSTKNIK